MAGPESDRLGGILETVGLVQAPDNRPPGGGMPYEVTEDTIAFLAKCKEDGSKFVVTDGGDVVVE